MTSVEEASDRDEAWSGQLPGRTDSDLRIADRGSWIAAYGRTSSGDEVSCGNAQPLRPQAKATKSALEWSEVDSRKIKTASGRTEGLG